MIFWSHGHDPRDPRDPRRNGNGLKGPRNKATVRPSWTAAMTQYQRVPQGICTSQQNSEIAGIIGLILRENLNRKPWFLPNIGLSCKFSHHPILWWKSRWKHMNIYENMRKWWIFEPDHLHGESQNFLWRFQWEHDWSIINGWLLDLYL